jgi:hypothetical protein
MKKRIFSGIAVLFLLFAITGISQAALTTIGTASYAGSDYKLIWDDDNNGNSVVWLDYSNVLGNWAGQRAWASGLESSLTYNIGPAYTVAWDDAAWRLPHTVDGPWVFGYDGTTTAGHNITNSEMGHLYYEELGNLAKVGLDGTYPQPDAGLKNTGDFENLNGLANSIYYSGTDFVQRPNQAWSFNMGNGYQNPTYTHEGYGLYGLAVRGGQVSAVPVPGAIWLLGSGLAGLAILSRRKTRNRV